MRELTEAEKKTIYLSMLHLGVVRWTKSSRRLEYALQYVIQHEDIWNMQMTELYVDISRLDHSTWIAVERSLRVIIHRLWSVRRDVCEKLFFHSEQHHERLSVSQFLYF